MTEITQADINLVALVWSYAHDDTDVDTAIHAAAGHIARHREALEAQLASARAEAESYRYPQQVAAKVGYDTGRADERAALSVLPLPDEALAEQVTRVIMRHFDLDPDVYVGMHGGYGEWLDCAREVLSVMARGDRP